MKEEERILTEEVNERGRQSAAQKAARRKDRIKNAIILFLVVLLILTFFSNTWMNRTLPQVATAYVQQASISPKIRGTGTVEADHPYKVVVKQSRKISSVNVRVGDEIHTGDVILELEDIESEELTAAQKALSELEVAYETSLFSGDVPDNVITDVRNDVVSSQDEYQQQLKSMNAKYEAAVAAKKAAEDQMAQLEAQWKKDSGETTYNSLTPEYTSALATYEIARLNEQLALTDDADAKEDIQRQINNFQAQIDHGTVDKKQLDTYNSQMQLGYEYHKLLIQQVIDDAKEDLEKVTEDKTKLTTAIKTEINLTEQKLQIQHAREKVEKLIAESVGTTVDSPVEGIVTSVGYTAGETTNADTPAAVIQVAGKDMIMSFSVTNAQARKVHIGDAAEPQNAWYYSEFSATLSAIKNDPNDPSGKKLLEFKIASPEVQAGQQVSIQIGQASASYDLTVPNSAIRQDNNGKYVLIVQSKSSPLGNRYVASRVDVEVQESDDTNTAITAALQGYEYVITTSSEPIKPGQFVRLAETDL
ncbi:MAG: HlyD family efflux transporter periplasmic adaptor subunit [Lachnospiraceae bacterium]|nr:HlyD family efflux transporter periplasmic adaptor subunit [Lachnospiraceae bacterium]